jgi:DNA polymerase-1
MVFGDEQNHYPIAILTRYLRERELRGYLGDIAPDTVAYSISTEPKAKNDALKKYLAEVLPVLCQLQVDYVLVTDGNLFKVMTKTAKLDRIGGYVLPCVLDGYKHLNVIYLPSPAQMIYDPTLVQKLNQGLLALSRHRAGTYFPPGVDIIQFAEYPSELPDIKTWLNKLVDVPLAIDIETFDLKHYKAGIGTISLAWNKHEGIAFAVDKDNTAARSAAIRGLLKEFFLARQARSIYHNGSFDIGVLIYQLFMDNLLDTEGLLHGLDVMLRSWDDTQLLTYLATNSCAGNKLKLKVQAQEFAGDYAVDVEDIAKVPLPQLLVYNLVDALSTWYVHEKHWPTVIADQQEEIYTTLFKPAIADIIQMQLTGMPMDMEAVASGKAAMECDRDAAIKVVMASQEVATVVGLLNKNWVEKRNSELKVKRVTLADAKETFNLNSSQQVQVLLYEVMKLPILSTTDTGQPSTGMEDIENLFNHAKTPQQKAVLSALIEFKQVDKLLTSFIPAFEQAVQGPDGHHYLFGFFNLGGTLSGRLSSNGPNLQNLPSSATKFKGKHYSKLIKKMFRAPKGWLFVGLDFASLEDRISALTTKDPNKLKVYTDGYDGHSLRAFYYFREQMPDIDDTVVSINSIQKKYGPQRQDSKAPTFALTYQGTWRTLVANCGFTPEFAQQIEARYHEMYVVSDKWVADKLAEAAKVGYVTIAFGLRLRTPMLHQSVMNTRKTPYEATAEGRTAGNALGQSYGLLNTRAATAFLKRVRPSQYRLDIRPCAQIHDAQYYLVRDNAETLAWVNRYLVEEVKWQELPEIQHPDVKLGGELSVFYPTWADELTIPNGADANQILSLADEHLAP